MDRLAHNKGLIRVCAPMARRIYNEVWRSKIFRTYLNDLLPTQPTFLESGYANFIFDEFKLGQQHSGAKELKRKYSEISPVKCVGMITWPPRWIYLEPFMTADTYSLPPWTYFMWGCCLNSCLGRKITFKYFCPSSSSSGNCQNPLSHCSLRR